MRCQYGASNRKPRHARHTRLLHLKNLLTILLEVRVTRLEDDRHEMKSAISQMGANAAQLNDRVGRVEASVGELNDRVARLDTNLATLTEHVSRLEVGVAEIKALLLATLPHLATKADLAEVRIELLTQITDKPSKTYMWGVLAVLLTPYACGLASLAVLR